MSSTIFEGPVKNKHEKIKQLESEIEALRSSTQQAIQRSFEDADRIRDEIYNELEKTSRFSEDLRDIASNAGRNLDHNELREIMELISSNENEGDNHLNSNSAILGSFSQKQDLDFDTFTEITTKTTDTGNTGNTRNTGNTGMGMRKKSIKNLLDIGGGVYTTLTDTIRKPQKCKKSDLMQLVDELEQQNEPPGLNASWHGNRRFSLKGKEKAEGLIRAVSSGYLNNTAEVSVQKQKQKEKEKEKEREREREKEVTAQSQQEREALENKLLNEIVSFEDMSLVACDELNFVLKEKDDMVEELEKKLRAQQNQIKHIQNAIDRTSICLEDATFHVDFPEKALGNNELKQDDVSVRVFLNKSASKGMQGMKRVTSFGAMAQFGKNDEASSVASPTPSTGKGMKRVSSIGAMMQFGKA